MARRQFTHSELSGSATTIALTLNGVVGGSLLVITVGAVSSTGTTITDVRDDLNNIGVSIGRAVYATNGYGELWYIKNATSGNRTVTVTYSSTAIQRYMCLIEADGDTSAPFDKTSKLETQDSATPHCLDVTTTTNGQYCVGLSAAILGTSLTATSPYGDVYVASLNSWTIGVVDFLQTTAGVTHAAWTSVNSSWFAIMGTFKASSGGGGNPVVLEGLNTLAKLTVS